MRRRQRFLLSVVVVLLLIAAPLVGAWVAEVTYEPPGRSRDYDGDGLTDEQERGYGTNPCKADSDGDGIEDLAEEAYWINRSHDPALPPSLPNPGPYYWPEDEGYPGYSMHLLPGEDLDQDYKSNIADPDADNDGVLDGRELEQGTDPAGPDCDLDGLLDGEDPRPLLAVDADADSMNDDWEAVNGVSDPAGDEDEDGVTDLEEFTAGTSPWSPLANDLPSWNRYERDYWVDRPLDSMSRISNSMDASTPIFQVDPPTPATYWRLMVFDAVDGIAWSVSAPKWTYMGNKVHALEGTPPFEGWPGFSAGYTYKVECVAGFATLPAPAYTTAITRPPSPTGLFMLGDGDAFDCGGIASSYSVSTLVPAYTLDYLMGANVTPGMDHYSKLTYKLANTPSELEGAKDLRPLERVLAAREWLWERAVLAPDHNRSMGDDTLTPLELERYGKGNTLDFASSLAVLGRALDVPTRLAVGFAPGIIIGQHRAVRAGDVHAWTEVAIGGYWVPVEATPMAGDEGRNIGVAGIDATVLGTAGDDDPSPQMGASGGGTTRGGRGVSVPYGSDTDGDGIPDETDHDDDWDGLVDTDEYGLGTNPVDPDTDHDGLNDLAELQHGTSPVNGDTDGDGIPDGKEVGIGTDPLDRDSDGAGSCDIQELEHGTDPTNPADDLAALDLDCDGLTDPQERAAGTNPARWDTDGDGLTDAEELALATDPLSMDTDKDASLDAQEVEDGTDPLVNDTFFPTFLENRDTDGDGLSDLDEYSLYNQYSPDSDSDGVMDPDEVELGLDPDRKDTDGDGMDDLKERELLEYKDEVRSVRDGLIPYFVIAIILTAALAYRYRPFDQRLARKVLDALLEADAWLASLKDRPDDEVRRAIYKAYEEVCRALAEKGLLKDEGSTVREFEVAIAEALPSVPKGLIDELTTLFEEARYSDHALPAGYVERARGCIAGIRGSLARELVTPSGQPTATAKA